MDGGRQRNRNTNVPAPNTEKNIPTPTSELRLETHRRSIGAFFFAVLQVEFAPKIRNLSTCRVVGWLLRSFRSRAARNALVVSRASKQASKAKASKQEEPLPTELLLFLRQLRATKLVLQYAARTHGVSADQ